MSNTNLNLLQKSLKRRHAAERRFRIYGQLAVSVALLILVFLLVRILLPAIDGLQQTEIRLSIDKPATLPDDPGALRRLGMRLSKESFLEMFPEAAAEKDSRRKLLVLLSTASGSRVAEALKKNPGEGTMEIWIPSSDAVDLVSKGRISREVPEAERPVTDQQWQWIDQLEDEGRLRISFNSNFFSRGDSREPEKAGFLGSIVGSLLTLVVCFAVAFPVGVMAAAYLEELSPKNRLRDIIEVNINNLAAVPSIVYGLLGLALWLNFFGLPRSAPLVGGLTLSLMTLPVIIITTRVSLKAVPDSLRQAALGLGATRLQTVFHHVLPLALPGIMTGTILGLARAIGETAPLLMIGMVAFIVDVPKFFTDAATVMPVQIYLWASSPEAGFADRTSAGIAVLILVLLLLNAVAIVIRKKYEQRW